MVGHETGTTGPQTPLATERRERLDVLRSNYIQALRKRIPKSDNTSLPFRWSPVRVGLQDSAGGCVVRWIIEDLREHLCTLMDMSLQRCKEVVGGGVEEEGGHGRINIQRGREPSLPKNKGGGEQTRRLGQRRKKLKQGERKA